jgi:hypothetical protein
MFVLTLLNFINDVTIDHKKQAGLKVQTPVTDLEAILEQAEHYNVTFALFLIFYMHCNFLGMKTLMAHTRQHSESGFVLIVLSNDG